MPLRYEIEHSVETAFERLWSTLANGDLLTLPEQEGFDVLVTTDGNLRYQQDLSSRRIAIVVLKTPSWPRIRQSLPAVVNAIDQAAPGSYTEVNFP